MKCRLTSLMLLVLAVAPAVAETFTIDPDHSSVSFKIRHLVGKVPGRFTKVSGTVEYDPAKPESWKTVDTVDAASIDTDNEHRDKHLRSADFFDVEKCKTLDFKSTKITDVDMKAGTAKLHGDLTMHCVTQKDVVFNLEIGGITMDPWGNKKAGFEATTKLNRKDYGIVWNKTLDQGSLMIGDDVEVTLEVEAAAAQPKKKAAPAAAPKKS